MFRAIAKSPGRIFDRVSVKAFLVSQCCKVYNSILYILDVRGYKVRYR